MEEVQDGENSLKRRLLIALAINTLAIASGWFMFGVAWRDKVRAERDRDETLETVKYLADLYEKLDAKATALNKYQQQVYQDYLAQKAWMPDPAQFSKNLKPMTGVGGK